MQLNKYIFYFFCLSMFWSSFCDKKA